MDGGFKVVAEVSQGSQVLPMVSATQPDVVLLDMRMPTLDGLACLDRIRASYPDAIVVMSLLEADANYIQVAAERGASGYLVKSVEPSAIAAEIREAVEGNGFKARPLADAGNDRSAREAGLTNREIDVMKVAARGLSNKMIAKELWITEQTVKFHLSNMFRKLGLSNRTELAHWVRQQAEPI